MNHYTQEALTTVLNTVEYAVLCIIFLQTLKS